MGISHNYGYILGIPIRRIVVFWGLYWGPAIFGNHIGFHLMLGEGATPGQLVQQSFVRNHAGREGNRALIQFCEIF